MKCTRIATCLVVGLCLLMGSTRQSETLAAGPAIDNGKQGNHRVAQQIEAAERTRLAKGEVGIKDRKPIPTFAEYAKQFRAKMMTDHAAKPKTAPDARV